MTLLSPLLTALYALFEAWRDKRTIDKHQPINHVRRWLFRAAVGLVIALLCAVPSQSLVVAGLLCITVAGVFSATFRMCLNKMRKMNLYYLGVTAWYDRLWLNYHYDAKVFNAIYNSKEAIVTVTDTNGEAYDVPPHLVRGFVHRRGRLATRAEYTISCAALIGATWVNL